jgi:rubredoxin
MLQTSFIPQGWECPKCKRVYSPTTSMCSHCPEFSQGYTSTGTTLTTASSGTWYGHNFESGKEKGKCKICGLQKAQHPLISYT